MAWNNTSTSMPHTTHGPNTLFNHSTDNQSNTSTSLDSSSTPVASSLAQQDTNCHGMPFRDPEMARIATSLQQSFLSLGGDELASFGVQVDIGLRFVSAMRARSHHPQLACRLATLLDSFTTDPNEKTALPPDLQLHLLGSKIRAFDSSRRKATEENQHAQVAILKLRDEINQLRSERDQCCEKASNFHHLEAHLRRSIDEHNRAVIEIQKLNLSNQDLKASLNDFMQRSDDGAPKVLSSQEVINRHSRNHPHLPNIPATQEATQIGNPLQSSSPWPPSFAQQSDQTTQHYGHVTSHQLAGPFHQGPMTPPSSTNPSPPQVGQKRGSDWLDHGTPSRETQPLAKKTKTTGTAKEKQAPKKPAVKKAAAKKPEPKRKAPRKTKKEKAEEDERMWTQRNRLLQDRLLGRSTEPIVIPDDSDEDASADSLFEEDPYHDLSTAILAGEA
ncbi:MAG: hypothetical protein Q9198_005091 [Flavoplaca austrocitrina]